eukprot:5373158-Prymnesium_polylepis.2
MGTAYTLLLTACIDRVMRLPANVQELGPRLSRRSGAQIALLKAHHVVDHQQHLCVQQGVGSQPALAIALLQLEPLCLDNQVARLDGVGGVERRCCRLIWLALEHSQPVETLDAALAPVSAHRHKLLALQ